MDKSRRGLRHATRIVSEGIAQRRHRPDYQIILYVGVLMLLGLVIMYAIGPQRANVLNAANGTSYYTDTYFALKQTASLVFAIIIFGFFAALPFIKLKSYSEKLLWAGFSLSALLLVTGNLLHLDAIAQCSLGACRWFNLGPLGSFQPAEFLKFALLVYIATFLGMRIKQGMANDVQKTLVPIGLVTLLALFFIVVVQKDMGTGIALSAMVASMLVVGGVSKKIGIKLLLVALALGVVLIISAPHRIDRVVTFFGGDSSSQTVSQSDANYHIDNAKIALGSGGLTGLGIGNSVQSTGYLPEAINDSVFAIMGETFGFVGVTAIITLFSLLLIRILKIGDHLMDPSMQLIAAGTFGWLGSHVILNIASMIGVFPLTGITLPLLSFGGTSMVFIAAALGITFQLSRYTTHDATPLKEVSDEAFSSRRRVRGTRNPSPRRY